MRDLGQIVNKNNAATIREHAEALADGNIALAYRIFTANPDLFPMRRPVQRVQTQRLMAEAQAARVARGSF